MGRFGKKGLALLLCAGLGASLLTGCGKKAEAAMFTYNGEAVDNKVATFYFRMNEASFDESYGQMFAQYYGSANVWDMDLTGEGTVYGETFKNEYKTILEHLLIAQDHASDYKIELSDEEKQKISDAADQFIADNSADTLKSMDADKDTVEKVLQMQTIQKKVEAEVKKTADTEVTDEEAAQRKVSYICYTPTAESETESETETVTEAEIAAAETEGAVTPDGGTEEAVTPVAAESETAVETEDGDKTKSADTESAGTEAASEAEPAESESETEDPETKALNQEFKAMAEGKLEEIKKSGEDFADISSEISSEGLPGVTASAMTFGKDDSYPDAAIIEATNDLDDDTLVDHVVEAGGAYYILHVDSKLDRDATDSKKEEIISDRQQTAVDDQYTEWEKDVTFTTDEEAFGKLEYDRSYSAPETSATEAGSTEAETDLTLEVTTEVGTETEAA